MYCYYMDSDFGQVEPRYLPPAGTILSDYWVWKILDMGITDFKGWNADFAKRGLRANRVPVGRPAVTLVTTGTTKTWHYIVVYGNIELHGDDGRRLGWSQILNRTIEKKPVISIGRPAIQSYANKVPAAMNLLGAQLAHLDNSSTPMIWTGVYTTDVPTRSPASSPAPIDAPTEIMTATDDSAPKRKYDTLTSPAKKVRTEKYLVISSSEENPDEVRYVSLSDYNELFQSAEQFQRMTYDLLHGLKAEISNATTSNKATKDLYESNWMLHKKLTKAMEKLTDVEVIVQK